MPDSVRYHSKIAPILLDANLVLILFDSALRIMKLYLDPLSYNFFSADVNALHFCSKLVAKSCKATYFVHFESMLDDEPLRKTYKRQNLF